MKKTSLQKIMMMPIEEGPEDGNVTNSHTPEDDWSSQVNTPWLLGLSIDQMPTLVHLKAVSNKLPVSESEVERNRAISETYPRILSFLPAGPISNVARNLWQTVAPRAAGQSLPLRELVKNSKMYALCAVAFPLVSLALTPFLTHNFSPSDYGIFAVLDTAIGLSAGITQLGLNSALFRVYGYDYTSERDKRDVLATATSLLFLVSILVAVMVVLLAPLLATSLLGRSDLSGLITIAGGVVLLQNLTVPGLAWLRAESRSFLYSVLSISNLLVLLLATIVLVGVLHLGVAGSLIATGAGYISIIVCTLPVIIFRAGIKIRADITRSLLSFGLPLIFNFLSVWILNLSDRYLLGRFSSFTETAKYAVVYTLGSALTLVIGTFGLAWPKAMFAIAKGKDPSHVFQLVFRWFSLFLLFAAFGLSFAGMLLLFLLFPPAYHSGAQIIPIVATSLVFYGVYSIFVVGTNVKRKTWLLPVFTIAAAVVNVILNLILIPYYGAMGAALSTLSAYIVLALLAYIANHIIYPIPFEINRFIVALLLGAALFVASSFLARSQVLIVICGIYLGALVLYGGCLVLIGKLPTRNHKSRVGKL